MVAPLADALKRCRFAPAIDNGVPVAASYEYSLNAAADNPKLAADRAWLGGEGRADIPIASWLVLKPIPVPKEEFSDGGADYVKPDGTVVLKPFEVDSGNVTKKAQMNAFNSNWFDATGAGDVHPAEGQRQTVDGISLSWGRVVPKGGFVNFADGLANCDYCIGYAWTEVEVPEKTDAVIGIGSDDAVKIWVNDTLVNDKWIKQQSRFDDDVLPVHLRKGKNRILIKIQNIAGEWSFICRLRTREH